MKIALYTGAIVFAVGALAKLLAIAWLGIATAIAVAAGSILVHTGGLEPKTFATCVTAAIVLDGVLLLAIITTSIARRVNQEDPGSTGLYRRHPMMVTAAWLLVALLAVIAAGWRRSAYFPYPLATIIVLANAYFFALLSVLFTGRVVERIWVSLRAWAQTGPYRAGFLTATLLLLGLAGVALRKAHLDREPIRRLAAHIDPDRLPATRGFADTQLAVLCIAADEIAPELAGGASAPGCRLLGDAGGSALGVLGSGSDCFTSLEPDLKAAKGLLWNSFRIKAYDADDITMDALLKTCMREPPPEDLRAYFFAVVRNDGQKAVQRGRRTVTCDDLDERTAPPGCSSELPELQELELERVWHYTFCTLDDGAARVLRSRLVDGLSFRAIGERWELPEDVARYVFHNAIKKLRRLLSGCLR